MPCVISLLVGAAAIQACLSDPIGVQLLGSSRLDLYVLSEQRRLRPPKLGQKSGTQLTIQRDTTDDEDTTNSNSRRSSGRRGNERHNGTLPLTSARSPPPSLPRRAGRRSRARCEEAVSHCPLQLLQLPRNSITADAQHPRPWAINPPPASYPRRDPHPPFHPQRNTNSLLPNPNLPPPRHDHQPSLNHRSANIVRPRRNGRGRAGGAARDPSRRDNGGLPLSP